MTTHTRTDIEATVEYECAIGDCGHDERPCPTRMYDCCQECSTRNWEESEGGVVIWDECGGTGMLFAKMDAESSEWSARAHSDPYCATHCSPGGKHSQCGCACDHRSSVQEPEPTHVLTEYGWVLAGCGVAKPLPSVPSSGGADG